MEFTQNTIILIVIAALVIAVVLIAVGRGRRSSKTTMGPKGVEFETRNEEEGAQTTSIRDVKITGSKKTSVETGGSGAHVQNIEVEEAEETHLKATKDK